MDLIKEARIRDFKKAYKLLEKYTNHELKTELDKAGYIHFFKLALDLAIHVMKNHLEEHGLVVENPRDAIKRSYQVGLITWTRLYGCSIM